MSITQPLPSQAPDFGGRSVYVIDDDEDIRRSLGFLLSTRNAVVIGFNGASTFLNQLTHLAPAPLIIDVRMPEMDGLQLLAELSSRTIRWPAIFLSGHGEIPIAVQALKLGAADFLEKPFIADELESCLAKQFATLDASDTCDQTQKEASALLSLLTPREAEVLSKLCEGLLNKQVAHSLGLSSRTVEMHRSNGLKRLGLKSLPEVVKLKVSAGVL